MGIGIETGIWEISEKIKERIEVHQQQHRAKNGFVFILDKNFKKIHPKTKEETLNTSELRHALKDEEARNILHNIVKDQITYFYLKTNNTSAYIEYCDLFNHAILDFLGTEKVKDIDGTEKKIEFPCLIYFKYENNECTDFLYQKLLESNNKYLAFYELATNLQIFVNHLNTPKINDDFIKPKSPLLELIKEKGKTIALEKLGNVVFEKICEFSPQGLNSVVNAISNIAS